MPFSLLPDSVRSLMKKEDLFGALKPKSTTTVGLDVGSYSLKCVEITKDEKGAVGLQSAQVLRLASNSPDGVKASLRTAFQAIASPVKRVRISVAGPAVLIRNVTFPRMTLEELKSAIRFEAERHIPFPINECVLDFQILGYTKDKLSMRVLLAAVKKELIDRKMKILGELGLEPDVIDADILCFANAYEKLSQDGRATYGLLSIGHELSSFAIVHEKELFFVREMAMGGVDVTRAAAELKKIPEPAADEWKKKHESQDLEELVLATRRGFEPLTEELKRSIAYFENEAGEELKAIFVAGGAAKSEGVLQILSEELATQVVLWNEAKKVPVTGTVEAKFLEDHFVELNVAYGLALRELG